MSDGANTPTPLQELQKAFCLFFLNSECRIGDLRQIHDICRGHAASDLSLYRPADAKVLLERHLETLPFPGDTAKVIAEFKRSPMTTVYRATAFSPKAEPSDTLNLWSPSPVAPVPGNCSEILKFLREVICDGDGACFDYLIKYLAHMLCVPEEKPGVMIVLLGGQGTGKGTFFKLLEAIWPHTLLQVSDVDHVTGSFNAALERSYVVCMDEALFSGDKKSLDRLKSTVTEGKVTIEQKYQPRRTIASYHRIFAASNHKHFAHVDPDDRRFVFLSLPPTHQGDHVYWKQLHAAVEDRAVIEAFVHALVSTDLTAFNVRSRPKTPTHIDQKLRSLGGFERWWYETLQGNDSGEFDLPLASPTKAGQQFVGTTTLLHMWQDHFKGHRSHAPAQLREIREAMSRICPSAKYKRQLRGTKQQRGFDLPTLTRARSEFEKFLGGPIDWMK